MKYRSIYKDRDKTKMKRSKRLFFFIICCVICLSTGIVRADSGAEPPAAEQNDDGAGVASFLWITDLQDCAYHPGEYAFVAEWCRALAEEKHVSFIMGTGDYVGKWYSEQQWEEFGAFLDIMNRTVPGLYIAGNHDYRLLTEDFRPFLERIYGNDDCSGDEYYKNGRGRYAIVKDGGLSWLVIGMSYSCGDAEREWISDVLERYPDYPAILLFHNYLESNGRFTAPGRRVYDEVIATHQNVRLVLCGHNHSARVRTDWPDGPDGRFVQTVMYNFQERQARRGSVQLLEIDVPAQTVHLLCQSPIKTRIKPLTKDFALDLSGYSGQ